MERRARLGLRHHLATGARADTGRGRLPGGDTNSRTVRYTGSKYVKGNGVSQPGSVPTSTAPFTTAGATATTTTRVEPATPQVRPSGDLSAQLLQRYRVDRGVRGVLLLLAHVPFDVLDDNDRIVNDDARGEHDAEEGERVDREAEKLDKPERSDQSERDGV